MSKKQAITQKSKQLYSRCCCAAVSSYSRKNKLLQCCGISFSNNPNLPQHPPTHPPTHPPAPHPTPPYPSLHHSLIHPPTHPSTHPHPSMRVIRHGPRTVRKSIRHSRKNAVLEGLATVRKNKRLHMHVRNLRQMCTKDIFSADYGRVVTAHITKSTIRGPSGCQALDPRLKSRVATPLISTSVLQTPPSAF